VDAHRSVPLSSLLQRPSDFFFHSLHVLRSVSILPGPADDRFRILVPHHLRVCRIHIGVLTLRIHDRDPVHRGVHGPIVALQGVLGRALPVLRHSQPRGIAQNRNAQQREAYRMPFLSQLRYLQQND